MSTRKTVSRAVLTLGLCLLAVSAFAQATATQKYEPKVGQAGKDVVWVPTSQALVNKMLDMAKVTPQDFVMDLGSGDGRTVITAAKRGATAMGIEYNPEMVELSKRNAENEGVTSEGHLRQGGSLRERLLEGDGHHDVPAARDQHQAAAEDPRPQAGHAHRVELLHDGRLGSRPDGNDHRRVHELVHGAPLDRAREGARERGTRRRATLKLTQTFQKVTGIDWPTTKLEGKLRGDEITLTAGKTVYTGRVNGTSIKGTTNGGSAWTASKR